MLCLGSGKNSRPRQVKPQIKMFGSIYNSLPLQDALNFCYSLRKNKKIEKSKFSKNKKGWYSEPFSPQTPEVKESFDSELAAKKPKLNAGPINFNRENCPVLQVSISQLQRYPTLKTSECSELHSYLCSEREFFSVGETKHSW